MSSLNRLLFFALPWLGLVAALALGFLTEPDPRGYGTHEQLGFGPCGFREWFGGPCPTCGVTTSVSHAAHGAWMEAWRTQPLGVILIVGCAIAGPGALIARLRGVDVEGLVARRGAEAWALFVVVATTCWLVSR
ncbi:MAG: DUF2752 domain-containing protein [Planctomycetota bacterium]